ncbi:hypothetical protein [Phenylobacterium sp.]|uniref:hypothetical protein n=1 Tax=Phenylobacterium sp. TaxID=1871053 RepID=UPI003567463A
MRVSSSGSMRRRRDVLALGAAAGLAPLVARAAAARQIKGFHPDLSPDAAQLMRWVRQLHDFGPVRATGTPQARAFEDWLERQFKQLGLSVERIPYRLTSWECDLKDCAISLTEDGKAPRQIEVVAYYPFAASTRGKPPVTGRLLHAGVGDDAVKALVARTDAQTLAASIVVVDMPLAGGGSLAKPKLHSRTFPENLPPYQTTPNPATQLSRASMEAVEGKVRGLVLCYTDVSDEACRYNYLPFSDKHRKIPALWVGRSGSEALRGLSGKATVSLRCDATLTRDARSDTLIATLPGPSEEVVFVTTQTDGPNEINENGAIGVLALATHAARAKDRRRTLVCSLPTGHYAVGAVVDPITGSGKPAGTRGVMDAHPEIMARTVGQLSLEQMGASDWTDDGGHWHSTGGPAPDIWLPTAGLEPRMIELFFPCTVGEDPRFSHTEISLNNLPTGEGGAPRAAGIPGFGLMGWPNYFFRADPRGVIDKFDPRIMKNEVNIATKLMILFDRLTPDQLHGRAPVTEADLFG